MKKALHQNQALHLVLGLDGKPSRFDKDSTGLVLQLANQVDDYEISDGQYFLKISPTLVRPCSHEEAISIEIKIFIERFIRNQANDSLLEDINSNLRGVNFKHKLVHFKKGEPFWEYWVYMTNPMPPKVNAAILISHLLSIGALSNVKECNFEECNSFFVGPPNRKWCSSKCGSIHRVRQKRKRDKF